jgi:hypothetical protein
VHVAQEAGGRTQVFARVGASIGASAESPEAQMAVGGQRSHGQLFGEEERPAVTILGGSGIARCLSGGDLCDEPERPCLVATLPVRAGEIEGASGDADRGVVTPRAQIALTEPRDPE